MVCLGPSTLRASAAGLETVGTLRLLLLDIKRHLFVVRKGHQMLSSSTGRFRSAFWLGLLLNTKKLLYVIHGRQ